MARNYANERQWQKEKYKKFGFTVDKELGERLVESCRSIGITPLQWFKERISYMVVVDDDTTAVSGENEAATVVSENDTAVVVDAANESTTVVELKEQLEQYQGQINDLEERLQTALKMNAIQENQELVTLKSEISKAFSLDYVDFHNSRQKEYSQDLFNVYRSILSRIFKGLEKHGVAFDDTTVVEVNDTAVVADDNTAVVDEENTAVVDDGKPPATYEEIPHWDIYLRDGIRYEDIVKSLEEAGSPDGSASDTTVVQENTTVVNDKPPVTNEIIANWSELNKDGLSYAKIAKTLSYGLGYSSSEIHRKVKKFRENQQ